MSRAAIALGGLIAVLVAGAAGFGGGYSRGQAAQVADQNANTVKQLGDQIQAHEDLVKRSTAANQALRQTMLARKKADKQSTEVLNHELNSTADSRAGCVFPVGVMRELATAHERAAQAATSGIAGAVPPASAATSEW